MSERAVAESEASAVAGELADLQTRYAEQAEELRLSRAAACEQPEPDETEPERGPSQVEVVARADAAVGTGTEAALIANNVAIAQGSEEQQGQTSRLLDEHFLRALLEHLEHRRPIHEFLAAHPLPRLHVH